MGESVVWWIVAGVAIVVVGVIVARLRGKRAEEPRVEPTAPGPVAPPAMPVVAEAVPVAASIEAAPAVVPQAAPTPAAPPSIAPAPPPVPQRPKVASAPAAEAAPRVVERPRAPALPRVARFELREPGRCLLAVERAAPSAWSAAGLLASTPVQRELLSALLARAGELDGAQDAEPVYAVHLPAGATLLLARGGAAAPESSPRGAIELVAAADFAAAALALQAARAALPALRGRIGEAKTVVAALHPKLVAATEGRVKSLVQDLARYLREAEENYAGAIRKPAFLSRVDAACEQAASVWQAAIGASAAAREMIETQARAPRFGEVQLEKSLAALRELQGQRRVMDAAARILAGWEQLRLLLGDAAPGGIVLLKEAGAALAAAAEADGRLATVLSAALDNAKAPDYVGKAEFNANRNAARELLPSLAPAALAAPSTALAHAATTLEVGVAGRAAQALLLKVDAAARVIEVREAA